MIRELEPGSSEYVWARITEVSGADLTGALVELCVTASSYPDVWAAPSAEDRSTVGVIRAAALVAPSAGASPQYFNVFARVTTASETIILRCGSFKVR
jgi:hypothetical protein